MCECKPGYTGLTCEIELNQCTSNPCENNGTCWNYDGNFLCHCLSRFTGQTCETWIADREIKNRTSHKTSNPLHILVADMDSQESRENKLAMRVPNSRFHGLRR